MRIPVQMRKVRPMEPAIATRTTTVFRATETPLVAAADGSPVLEGAAVEVVEPEAATMTVLVEPGPLSAAGVDVEVKVWEVIVDDREVVVLVVEFGANDELVVFRAREVVVGAELVDVDVLVEVWVPNGSPTRLVSVSQKSPELVAEEDVEVARLVVVDVAADDVVVVVGS